MANTSLAGMLRDIRQLAGVQANQDASDEMLLQRFVEARDETAFTVLIERHGPMVLGVCRRALGNTDDAEDAFQATFLVLARKAAAIHTTASLGSWLYRVARSVSANQRRERSRREQRERGVPSPASRDPAAEVSWREVQAALDEELDRLPEGYRGPFVLCYLEGLTRDEAAARLGVSPGALHGRLERGRKLLGDRLIRRGLTLSAVLAASGIGEGVAQAGPSPAAVLSLGRCALALANGRTDVGDLVTADVLALFNKAVRDMASRRLLIGVVGLLWGGLLLAGVSAGLALSHGVPGTPPGAAGEVREEALAADRVAGENRAPRDERTVVQAARRDREESAPADSAGKPAEAASRPTLRVVVLDPRGKPLEGADIHAGIWTDEKGFKANRDYKTDAAGVALVELPRTMTILRLWARKRSFAPLFANWERNELGTGQKFPTEHVFRLERGVTAGGRLVDENGKPVVGARVQVQLTNDPRPTFGDGRTRYDRWLAEGDHAKTDAEGRWAIDNVPNHPEARLELMVSHPEHASDEQWGGLQRAANVTTRMLRDGTATLTLKRGIVVRGRLTDPAGKPVQAALVVRGDEPGWQTIPRAFPADADGRFRLPPMLPGETTLTVVAPGWAPQLRRVTLKPGLPPQDFRLEKGKPIRLRIVDGAGKPVPRALVRLMEWKGCQSLLDVEEHPRVPGSKITKRGGADGRWEWTWAPDDPVKLQVSANGYCDCDLEIKGGAPERTVTLQPEHRVAGQVLDAATGQPVPAFTVIPIDVFRKSFLHAERGHAQVGRDGRLNFLVTRTDYAQRLRIEAAGYRTQDGPEFRVGDDSARVQHFRLQRSKPLTGRVLDIHGRPVAKATVLLATPTQCADISSDHDNQRSFTDDEGRFAFPDSGEPWTVLVQADAGSAHAEFPAGQHDAGTLRLQPWASVRGTFRDGGRLVRGATVLLEPIHLHNPDRPRIQATLQVVTGADGRFTFSRVMPGPVHVHVHLGPWKDEGFRSGPSVPLDLRPGEKAELDLGGAGAVVTGRVKLTGKVPADLDCNYSLNHLVRREPGIQPPPAVAAAGFDARRGWRDAWQQTTEGQAYLRTLQNWFVKLAPDGGFQVSGVPSGEYDLAVAVYAKPAGCLIEPLARKVVRVKVTEADVKRGKLAVPEIPVEVVPVPSVGDTPKLTFQRPDGGNGSLADLRGRYTLVHFWASWCGACKHQLPELRRLQARFAGRGLATLSLSLDDHPGPWRAALKQQELPWPQGRLTSANEARESGVPVYWLLDPAGRIVARGYDPDDLVRVLSDQLK
jgi:RNA polymerase sigma factor (sigma-70 family)